MKQAIVVRTDLKMGKGKIASQSAHASVTAFINAPADKKKDWAESGMKKIVLKVSGEEDLKNLEKLASKEKIPCALIHDAGLTQIEPGSITALAIGPDSDAKVDKIVGKLKLL